MDRYILEGKKAVKCKDLQKWASQSNPIYRRVAKDTIGDTEVSTVFLGIDHSPFGEKPLLFETMVFGGELNQEQIRYETWEEAEFGHDKMVAKVIQSE